MVIVYSFMVSYAQRGRLSWKYFHENISTSWNTIPLDEVRYNKITSRKAVCPSERGGRLERSLNANRVLPQSSGLHWRGGEWPELPGKPDHRGETPWFR